MFFAFLLPIPHPKHSPSMVFNCRAPESNKAFTAKRWPFSQALCLRPWTETVNERGKHQGSWKNIASNVNLMLTNIFPLAPVISFTVWPNKHQQKCKRNRPEKKNTSKHLTDPTPSKKPLQTTWQRRGAIGFFPAWCLRSATGQGPHNVTAATVQTLPCAQGPGRFSVLWGMVLTLSRLI